MFPSIYVRPVAYHRFATDQLLLKDEAGNWYLWMANSEELVEIEQSLAQWIYKRPEIFPVSGPAMWFDAASLPTNKESRFPIGD